jgi:hypothetical protein
MVLPWISTFLVLFSGGTLLFTASIPRREVGDRFYRVSGYVALFLGVTAALTSGIMGAKSTVVYWPLLAYVGVMFVLSICSQASWFKGYEPMFLLLSAASVVVGILGRKDAFHVFPALHYALSGYVLGAALVSMLLGHSYLESNNQSFDLLVNACRALILGLVLRGIVSVVTLGPAMDRLSQLTGHDVVLGLFAAMRVVVGILFALALSWMSLSCAKIKSNQSATGILYVVVGFVIIGELVAAYLGIEKDVLL